MLWPLNNLPTRKAAHTPSLLIALYDASSDAPTHENITEEAERQRKSNRCQICNRVQHPITCTIQGKPICDDCGRQHIEGKEFYGVRAGVGTGSYACGQYRTLQEAMRQVRMLDRMGYEFRVFKGRKHWRRDEEILHWIPIVRFEDEETDAMMLKLFPKNRRSVIAKEVQVWREASRTAAGK